jgi:rod shape-determining protein MreD
LKQLRYVLLAILPLGGIFLQTTFLHRLSPAGVLPDMILIFVVCYSLYNGSVPGGVYGTLFGLVEDFYSGRMLGVNALCKGVVGYCVGKLHPSVYRERLLLGVLSVLAATVLNSGLRLILIYCFYQERAYDHLAQFLVHVGYNVTLTAPIYIWYYYSSHHGWLRKKTEYNANG